MSAADRLRELYNKASDRERDENCETFWKVDAIPSAKGKKGKGKGAERVLNPFSEKQILRTAETYKELKKLCEAHELKKTQIGHLHVPKAEGVKEESSSDSEQSGDDETQPDDDRKDPHLMLPNVGENNGVQPGDDHKGEQTGDEKNGGELPPDVSELLEEIEGGELPPEVSELLEEIEAQMKSTSDGSAKPLNSKRLGDIANTLKRFQEMQKHKKIRKLSRCENENILEVAGDLLYCSYDRYYAMGVTVMSAIWASVLVSVSYYGAWMIAGTDVFNTDFKNEVWPTWFSIDLPKLINEILNSIQSDKFFTDLASTLSLSKDNIVIKAILDMKDQMILAYEGYEEGGSAMAYFLRMWIRLNGEVKASIPKFIVWKCIKAYVSTIIRFIRAISNHTVSRLMLELVTINYDSALIFANIFRSYVKYLHCDEFIPAKIACEPNLETHNNKLKIILLSSSWTRLDAQPDNKKVLSVDTVHRDSVDITEHLDYDTTEFSEVKGLHSGDVLYTSTDIANLHSLRRETQIGDPRGVGELQMSFKPGLVLKVVHPKFSKPLFFKHVFSLKDAADCKTYDPAVCLDY